MGLMKSKTAISILVLIVASALGAPAFARGSGVHKDYRDPNLWNADAYVSDQDKAAMYYNPRGNGFYAAQPVAQGALNNNATMNNSVPGQVYGGPAFIGPQNYDTVVQTYSWPAH